MKVLHDNVLLREVKKPQAPGIIALDGGIEKIEVVEVGDQVTKLKAGDTVFYYQGNKVMVQGEEYILTEEKNIKIIL